MKVTKLINSGETGSGKSFSFNLIQHHMLAISCMEGDSSTINARIRQAQSVLAAFTHAIGDQNNHQSFFGSYVEHQFNSHGRVVGAKYHIISLCAARIGAASGSGQTHQNGRSYDIFYQLLCGLSGNDRKSLGLTTDASKYQYLSKFKLRINHAKDNAGFCVLQDALKRVGLKEKTLMSVWKTLATILHLGNINFVPTSGDSNETCTTRDLDHVDTVASLTGIPGSLLIQCLTSRSVQTQSSRYSVVLSVAEIHSRRDCLARWLYTHILQLIVDKINKRISQDELHWSNYLSLLDIPGYATSAESPADGLDSFNQMLVSYTNAKLQEFVSIEILQKVHDLFEREGIHDPSSFNTQDRAWARNLENLADVLHSESLSSLMKARGDRDFDQAFLEKLKELPIEIANVSDSSNSKSLHTFVIKHFDNTDFTYDATGWLGVNQTGDTAIEDLKRALTGSNVKVNPLIRDLLQMSDLSHTLKAPTVEVTPPSPRGNSIEAPLVDTLTRSKHTTIVSQLKANVSDILDALSDTQIWWLPHIRISRDPKALTRFDPLIVLSQVNHLGISQFVNSQSCHFTLCMTHTEFIERFSKALPMIHQPTVAAPLVLQVESLAQACDLNSGADYLCGTTQTFLSEGAWRSLECKVGTSSATVTQSPDTIFVDSHRHQNYDEEDDGLDEISAGYSDEKREGAIESGLLQEEPLSKKALKESIPVKNISKSRRNWLCITWCLTWYGLI
jgi:chitin synthase